LRLLQAKGHEIGCHGFEHIGVGEYSFSPARTQEYLAKEVLPAMSNMVASGFYPMSFSYPSGESD
jgi:peptidoglycan/xylan/chitin deacetylase (PgdA/CDA1 family)